MIYVMETCVLSTKGRRVPITRLCKQIYVATTRVIRTITSVAVVRGWNKHVQITSQCTCFSNCTLLVRWKDKLTFLSLLSVHREPPRSGLPRRWWTTWSNESQKYYNSKNSWIYYYHSCTVHNNNIYRLYFAHTYAHFYDYLILFF